MTLLEWCNSSRTGTSALGLMANLVERIPREIEMMGGEAGS